MNSHAPLDELERCSKAEDDSIQLIFEFLACQGLNRTLTTLKEEIVSVGLTPPNQNIQSKDKILKHDVSILINLLETSDHKSFFKNWESLIPPSVKELNEYKKLTIYLFAYFSTLPFRTDVHKFEPKYEKSAFIREEKKLNEEKTETLLEKLTNLNGTFIVEKPCQENIPNIDSIATNEAKFETDSLEDESDHLELTSAMEMFKLFLLDHGAQLADEPEFLPYFALPFVENPKNHPTFLKIFEEAWVINLKQSFKQFLLKYSCGDSVIPEIVKMCKHLENDHQSVEVDSTKSYKDVKRRMHKLKRDHQKLVGVASELALALEKSVQGEAVDLKSTLLNCISIFPDLFSMHVPIPERQWNQSGNNLFLKKQILHSHLDAHKIKHDLYNATVKTQLLLLQALRWHLTQSEAEEREQFVLWLARQDVLGLRSCEISEFLSPAVTPHPLLQSVVRLLNAIASLNCGRDYIESSGKTTDLLFEAAKCNSLDRTSEDMIVAAVQKLSLRKQMCEIMTGKGLIEHFLNKLKMKQFNKYTYEYSTSLLMNLALYAPVAFWDKHTDISTYLIDLLLNSENEAKEFLTGILCCVLRNELVNRHCSREGFGVKLSKFYSKNKDDPVLGKQLDTLLKLHRREISPFSLCLDQNCEDELEDPEELDAEIDENDMVKGSICGEEFLEQYCLIFPLPGVVGRNSDKFHKFVLRPTSPGAKLPRWATGD